MRKHVFGTAAGWGVVCILALGVAAAQITPEVIYGDDDRLDIYEVKSPKLKQMAGSTVGLFKGSAVTVADGKASLRTSSYGSSYNLCQDEPFRDQRSGAFCSGALVGPDLIMTAGHCVRSEYSCKNTKFVFGFSITEKGGSTPSSVPASEVYGCSELIKREQVGRGADYALLRLDRVVANHKPLKISRSGVPPKGTPLIVIGHPSGLPTKVAGGASVRDPDRTGYFVANLDTYGGNSGSAVFNAYTGEVVGILVRGETDFVWDSQNSCRRSNECADDGCRGEDVTNVGELASLIPKQGAGGVLAKPGPNLRSLINAAGASSR